MDPESNKMTEDISQMTNIENSNDTENRLSNEEKKCENDNNAKSIDPNTNIAGPSTKVDNAAKLLVSKSNKTRGAIPKDKIKHNPNEGAKHVSQEQDGCVDENVVPPGRPYPIRIRHVCDDCNSVLKNMIKKNELIPLMHANVCPSCDHRSMHQPYYNICSICVRLWKKCAMCCCEYNEGKIDALDVLLSPKLRTVMDILPDMYQRVLHRFTYKRWEHYLRDQSVPIELFREEFMDMCLQMCGEIEEMKKVHTESKNSEAKYSITEEELLERMQAHVKEMKKDKREHEEEKLADEEENRADDEARMAHELKKRQEEQEEEQKYIEEEYYQMLAEEEQEMRLKKEIENTRNYVNRHDNEAVVIENEPFPTSNARDNITVVRQNSSESEVAANVQEVEEEGAVGDLFSMH